MLRCLALFFSFCSRFLHEASPFPCKSNRARAVTISSRERGDREREERQKTVHRQRQRRELNQSSATMTVKGSTKKGETFRWVERSREERKVSLHKATDQADLARNTRGKTLFLPFFSRSKGKSGVLDSSKAAVFRNPCEGEGKKVASSGRRIGRSGLSWFMGHFAWICPWFFFLLFFPKD